jgi:hypothetical protein
MGMATPDPRQGGDDQPQDTGWNAELRGRPQDQPVAPEPKWEKRQYFNRERFLLRCVAWIIGVQFGFFIAATVHCAAIVRSREALVAAGKPVIPGSGFCDVLPDKLQGSADQGLAVLLALLGGGALALSERPRQDPRKGGDRP